MDVDILPDGRCANDWVCEHRWTAIAGMVGFAKATNGQPVLDFWSEGNQASWRRGEKGFLVVTNELPLNRYTCVTGV